MTLSAHFPSCLAFLGFRALITVDNAIQMCYSALGEKPNTVNNLCNFVCGQNAMSSLLSEKSEKLDGVECYKLRDSIVGMDNSDSTAVEAAWPVLMMKNVTKSSEDAENMLSSSPADKECENVVEHEVSIQEKSDGRYSWVIVCASFVNCFIIGTMFIGFSILYVEITEYFGSSKGVAGWVGSLYMASGNIFGEICLAFFVLLIIILGLLQIFS